MEDKDFAEKIISYRDKMRDEDSAEEMLSSYIIDGIGIMRKFRGEIIEMALQIEYALDDIISNYYSKETKKKNDQFRKNMLDSRFCTSHQKIRIFSGLKLHKNAKFKNKFDDLIKRMHQFNEARNDFAHGLRDSYHHEFKVRWKGKSHVASLDDDFQKEIDDEFQYIITGLKYIQNESGLMINWPKYEQIYGSDDETEPKSN
jgi:hypothetical protein